MIIFYTIGCPACNVLQAKLDQKKVEYKTITDEKIFQEMDMKTFPMLEVDDNLMNFSQARKWVDSLQEEEN